MPFFYAFGEFQSTIELIKIRVEFDIESYRKSKTNVFTFLSDIEEKARKGWKALFCWKISNNKCK